MKECREEDGGEKYESELDPWIMNGIKEDLAVCTIRHSVAWRMRWDRFCINTEMACWSYETDSDYLPLYRDNLTTTDLPAAVFKVTVNDSDTNHKKGAH
ncbi:hypothetical protein J6590_026325 [Homalodisca vitripennis]|nr:hypothetical protein J6590_026325 [Homalodisca vitripennis]